MLRPARLTRFTEAAASWRFYVPGAPDFLWGCQELRCCHCARVIGRRVQEDPAVDVILPFTFRMYTG